MHTIIYNCTHCKTGRRVDYPIERGKGYFYRLGTDDQQVPAGVWVQACGGGKPTVYGGDTEMGICRGCHRMMKFGALKAHLNPNHKCDARCTSARGHNCECACGGVNHGTAA